MSEEVRSESGTPATASTPAPASAAGTPDAAVSASAPAIEASADGGSTATPKGSWIPQDRHEAVLRNAREEARKEYEQKYAWARELTPEQVREWREAHDLPQRDPHRFNKMWSDWYARTYGTSPSGRQAAQEDTEPSPDLVAENGQPVYSAPQLRKWQEWNERRLEAKFNERLQPIESRHRSQDAADQVKQNAQRVINELRELPHFEELRPRIAAILKEDGRATPRSAYHRAFTEWEADSESRTRKALADELKQKANASTTNPSAPSASQPTDFKRKSFAETTREVFRQLRGA